MNTATITVLDDERLIRDGEAAVSEYQTGRAHARKQIMPMALGLLAARRKFPANNEFGRWLDQSHYVELGSDDRAALIKIGENGSFATKFIRSTHLTSPRTIWSAIEELLPASSHNAKTNTDSTKTENLHETAEISPETETVPSADLPRENSGSPLGPRHPFIGLKRGAEVAAIYLDSKTRGNIGAAVSKRGGRDIWSLILEFIDAGILAPTDTVPANVSARLLFPQGPNPFCRDLLLTNERHRALIRNEVLPAVIANRDAYLANPASVERIFRAYQRSEQEKRTAEIQERKLTEARQDMGPNEIEVTLYGKHFWPIVDIDDPDQRYDYSQLTAAAWFFNEALKMARFAPDNSPKSCGMKVRFLLKHLVHFNSLTPADDPARARWRHIFNLATEMTRLMEQRLDADSEAEIGNKWPMLPSESEYGR